MGRREVIRQNDFAFGELSPDYAASDVEAKSRALKAGLNLRILNSYGVAQRFGSRRMATAAGAGIAIELVIQGQASNIGIVRAGGIDIYSQDGSLLQSVGGAPWSAGDISGLVWHARKNEVYFTSQSYWPRLLSYSGGSWSLDLVDFDSGAGGSSTQPYYRFAPPGITLTPSGTTGSIDLVFSDAVLDPNHVGVRFRYGSSIESVKEIEITTVTDGENAIGTVIDELPPTYDVVVADASGYRAGEDVQGLDSQASGVISAIDYGSDTLTVLMSDNYNSFTVSTPEYIVGPFHRSLVVSVTASGSPAASTVWDEAALSPVRGYPGDVFERSSRLGFADFPQIPGAIVMSSPGALHSFNVGKGEPQDAIFFILAEGGQRVLYCVSSANLILLTDKKVLYVPEDETAPLSAATFDPIEIGPAGASTCVPVTVEEGVIYVEAGGNRVMGLLSTGQITAPYQLQDLSRHAAHLIKSPISLAMTNGNAQAPERYIFALNADGTLTCMFFDTNPVRLGLTPWETDGAYLAMVSIKGIIYGICERDFGGAVYLLERLDADAQMDASSVWSSEGTFTALTDDAGDPITDDAGDAILTDFGALPHLAGQTVIVMRGTEYLGSFTVEPDGSIPGISSGDGDFEGGLHFDVDMTLWPPETQDDQRTMFSRRRIPYAAIRVQNSCVYTIGLLGRPIAFTRSAYDQGDDPESAPPLRNELKRAALTGYDYEPCLQVTRPLPQPLTVLSVAQEVSL